MAWRGNDSIMKKEGLKRGLVNADYDSDNEEIYDIKPKVESKFQSTETTEFLLRLLFSFVLCCGPIYINSLALAS